MASSSSPVEDASAEVRGWPLWEIDRAVRETARFEQRKNGRWKATYAGFVTLSAEGATPTESERRLNDAMDAWLAKLIRGSQGREKPDATPGVRAAGRRTDGGSEDAMPAGSSPAEKRVQKRR